MGRMTDPSRTKAQIAGVFDRSAATYGQGDADFVGPVGADLVAAAGLRPGQRVLDVGCGRGASLFPAVATVGVSGYVLGVDLAPSMVAATAAEARRRGLANVDVRLGDAEGPDGSAEAFDAVLAGLVIFFLPDPVAAARAYHRLLRRGGRLALSTFCEELEGKPSLRPLLRTALAEHVALPPAVPGSPPASPETRLRTRESLAELLAGTGFSEVAFDERRYEVRFAGPDQFWDWLWSHGARAALESIPDERMADARASVCDTASRLMGTTDGSLTLPIDVRLTTAIAG